MTSTIKILAGAILISLIFSGCDTVDKLDDVAFEGVLPLEFEIHDSDVSADPVMYLREDVLNALDNDEIEKYQNKIKEIKLTKVTYEITGFDAPGDVTFSEGSIKVGTSKKALASIPSIDLENTPETELTGLNIDGVNEFALQLNEDQAVEVSMSGTASKTPLLFTLVVRFHVSVTAEVLK